MHRAAQSRLRFLAGEPHAVCRYMHAHTHGWMDGHQHPLHSTIQFESSLNPFTAAAGMSWGLVPLGGRGHTLRLDGAVEMGRMCWPWGGPYCSAVSGGGGWRKENEARCHVGHKGGIFRRSEWKEGWVESGAGRTPRFRQQTPSWRRRVQKVGETEARK